MERTQKLLSEEPATIAATLGNKNSHLDQFLKRRLPIINCDCGAEILVVPDVKAVNRAIRTHVAEHGRIRRNSKKYLIASDKISKLLSERTLIKMSEQNNI